MMDAVEILSKLPKDFYENLVRDNSTASFTMYMYIMVIKVQQNWTINEGGGQGVGLTAMQYQSTARYKPNEVVHFSEIF